MTRLAGSRFGGARGGSTISGASEPFRIVGSSQVGTTLTLSGLPTVGPNQTYQVQWYLSGNAISGATGTTYELIQTDLGETVTATATLPDSSVVQSANSIIVTGIATTPDEISASAWTVTPIDGDTDEVLITFNGPYPPDGGADITGVKRRRTVGSTVYGVFNLRAGGQLPVIGQGYRVPADPAPAVNSYELFCANSIGNGDYGTPKTCVAWAAPVGVPSPFTINQWTLTKVPSVTDKLAVTFTSLPVNNGAAITEVYAEVDEGAGYGQPILLSGISLNTEYQITVSENTICSVKIWAKNSAGDGTHSDVKTETPTAAVVTQTTSVVTAVNAAGTTITVANLSQPVEYITTPDGSFVFFRPAEGWGNITVTMPLSEVIGTEVIGGAMWEPMASSSGNGTTNQGFDSRIVTGGGNRTTKSYVPSLNVAVTTNGTTVTPGAAYQITGEGSLVISVPNKGTVGTNYSGQRSAPTRAVDRYAVVTFLDTRIPEGSLRPAASGPKENRSNMVAQTVITRLDTVFPPNRDLSSINQAPQPTTTSEIEDIVKRVEAQAASGSFATLWSSEPLAPNEGTPFYGQSWARDIGKTALQLFRSETITLAQRQRVALALAQIAIDLVGVARSGRIFQSNGGATHGRNFNIEVGAELLDDDYFRNLSRGVIGAQIAPSVNLVYLPFAEQRTHRHAVAVPRTTGTGLVGEQATSWGAYVGSGGALLDGDETTRPDSVPISTEDVGQPRWCISPDRTGSISSNSRNLWAAYHADNMSSQVDIRTVLQWMTHTLVAGTTDRGTIEEYIDCLDLGYWVTADAAREGITPDVTRYGSGGSIDLHSNGEFNLASILPQSDRRRFKPIAFHPNVVETNGGFIVNLHPYAVTCGLSVDSTNLRWRKNNNATWTVVTNYASGDEIVHGGALGDDLDVQIQVHTAQGWSAWTVNEPNKLNPPSPKNPPVPDPYPAARLPRATFNVTQVASNHTATLNALALLSVANADDPVFYDSGAARGVNAAFIPLSGTSTAPIGTTIQARIVRADSTATVVQDWQDVGLVQIGGVWSGGFSGAQRSRHRLRVEVRVAQSAAATVINGQDIIVGHIVALIGQSEDHQMMQASHSLQPVPTLPVGADDSVFVMQWSGGLGSFAANGIKAVNGSTLDVVPGVSRSMAHMANILTRNTQTDGDKFLFIAAVQVGTSYIGLVDDVNDATDKRAWGKTFGEALDYIRSWGADLGVLMSTWTAAPSSIAGGYRVGHYPIIAGVYADATDTTPIPIYGSPVDQLYCPAGYQLDHGFWDLSAPTPRAGAVLKTGVTRMFFYGPHRFEDSNGILSDKQACRKEIRKLVVDPVLAQIMLPKGPEILAYQNGFGVTNSSSSTYEPNPANWGAWKDWAHPSAYTNDGLPSRARHTAVAILYAFGVGPAAAVRRDVPKFNKSYWEPNGAYAEFWYEDSVGVRPDITTTRLARGEAQIPATYPHRTEVAGFRINSQPATNVVIATKTFNDSGVISNTDVVRVYPPSGVFTYADKIEYGVGGASGVVQFPEDEYDSIWKNLPIAVVPGFDYSSASAGLDGIAVEPMPTVSDMLSTLPAPENFSITALGEPNFLDPVSMGSGVAEFTIRLRIKCEPSGTTTTLASMTGGALKFERLFDGSLRFALQDSSGTGTGAMNLSATAPDDQWVDILIAGKLPTASVAGSLKVWNRGTLTDNITLAAASGLVGTLQPSRFIAMTPRGTEVEILQWWKGFAATSYAPLSFPAATKTIVAAANNTYLEAPSASKWNTLSGSATVPSVMSAPTLVGGSGEVTVEFASTPTDGGIPLIGYGYEVTLESDPTFAAVIASGTQPGLEDVVVTGLAAGNYIARNWAINAHDDGVKSTASSVATVTSTGTTPAPWAGAVNTDGFIYTASAPIGSTPNATTDSIVLQSPGFDSSGNPTTRTRTIPFLGYGRNFYPNGGTAITTQAILAQRVFAGEVTPANASNNSTKSDRAPFIGFLTPAHRWLTTPSITIDVFVDHWHAMDGKPVAAVRGAVKDSAGTVFYGPWVSTETAVTSTASGLTVPAYRLTVNFTGAASGLIKTYVQVAPNIGLAIYDQLAAEPTDQAKSGNVPQTHYYDATDTMRRYVTLGGADDTPKGVGTTAGTAPAYLTVNGAATALDVAMTDLGLGGVILLPDGVTAAMSPGLNSRATNAFGIQINGVGPLYNGVITTGGDSADYVFEKAIWNRVTIDGTGAGRVFSNRATSAYDHYQTFWKVNLVNCPTTTTDYFQNAGACRFWECTSDSPDGFTSDVQGNTVTIAAYLSSKIGGNSTSHAIGCKLNTQFSPNVGAQIKAPICAYNLMHAAGGNNNVKLDSFLSGQDGFCIVGNVMTHTGSISDDNIELEGSAPEEFYNAILAHNTCIGGGTNGSRSNQGNEENVNPLYHEMKVVSCIFEVRVKQGDYDNLGAAADPGSRRRNHPVRWGVDEAHNITHRIAAPAVFGFNQNDGERASLYSINPTTRMSFVNDRTASGTNNATIDAPGDYRLVAANIPGNIPRPVGPSLHHTFDLFGNAIPTNGTALPGAIQSTA